MCYSENIFAKNFETKFAGVLGDWLLQPARILDGHAPGGDPKPQGLGPGQRHLPELGHQVPKSNFLKILSG
jgi:hypothetical protein